MLINLKVWNITLHDGKFILEHVKRMNHMDTAGFNVNAAITCIVPMSQVVYTGDDDGRVVDLFRVRSVTLANPGDSLSGTVYSDMTGVEEPT